MKKVVLIFALLYFSNSMRGVELPVNSYAPAFEKAYQVYPELPAGILEAVAFTQTRFTHFTGLQEESCLGLPKVFTIMGLTLDGKSYFRNNLLYVSSLTSISTEDILSSTDNSILAYAKALVVLKKKHKLQTIEDLFFALRMLSEIPTDNLHNQFASDSYLYGIYWFLTNPDCAAMYNFNVYKLNEDVLFGSNFNLLKSQEIIYTEESVKNKQGIKYKPKNDKISPDYPSALWDPAPSCNYSSRNGVAISAITIHTIQGSYAGAISWAKNCNSNVSYHYVIRSIDGQITQMVLESNKAWHVGSENPYTIGYEHEGWVNQPGWYTTAMYTASANLTKYICNKNYGINPLRTFQGPATSGINVLGNCIRIKGHQHYPNQNHTDPGIYWDWEKYYQLINDNPNTTTYTAVSGTFYDSGGPNGNYSNDERKLYLIQPTGASTVTLTFSQFNLENNWDFMRIYDGNNLSAPMIGKYTGTNSPGTITSSGNSLLLDFRSDCATTAPGWAATWLGNINNQQIDSIPPTTSISVPGNWVTQNFTATFTDQDNQGGSGLEKSYYQVLEYTGTEWRANETRGFFSDNFDVSIHPDWTISTGNWSIQNSFLVQSDEGAGNTNIYASLNQLLSNRYLYHWAGKIEGNGSNRRAGFHFFCDNASLPNRNNSYFVWYRVDDNKLQLYKVNNDVFTLVLDQPYTFNANQWYDNKIIFDRISGKVWIYINNNLAATWTDTNPHTSGNQISFRSGNSKYTVNDLKVYRSRFPSVTVTVGAGNTNDLRYQNPNPIQAAGRIKSIVADSAGNLSAIAFKDVNVDWTSPSSVVVNDGIGNDIDTTYMNTELSANWTASSDSHSGIDSYVYCVGTTPGDSDIVSWTYNWSFTSVTDTGLNLNYNQTYYYTVRAKNGAGLFSTPVSSNGQIVIEPTLKPIAGFSTQTIQVCEGDPLIFTNNSQYATTYLWSFPGGNPNTSTATNPAVYYSSSGNYTIELIATGPGGADTNTQILPIQVFEAPIVDFVAVDTILHLPNAFAIFINNTQNATSWLWDFGDGNFSTAQQPWHQYTQVGEYTVFLTAYNGLCPSKDLFKNNYIKILYPLGISGLEEHTDFSVFPNPFTHQLSLFIQAEKSGNLMITLFDAQGKMMLSFMQQIHTGNNHIALDDQISILAKGLYNLQIKSPDNKNHTLKIVKSE